MMAARGHVVVDSTVVTSNLIGARLNTQQQPISISLTKIINNGAAKVAEFALI
jgi:hypothetical protein